MCFSDLTPIPPEKARAALKEAKEREQRKQQERELEQQQQEQGDSVVAPDYPPPTVRALHSRFISVFSHRVMLCV